MRGLIAAALFSLVTSSNFLAAALAFPVERLELRSANVSQVHGKRGFPTAPVQSGIDSQQSADYPLMRHLSLEIRQTSDPNYQTSFRMFEVGVFLVNNGNEGITIVPTMLGPLVSWSAASEWHIIPAGKEPLKSRFPSSLRKTELFRGVQWKFDRGQTHFIRPSESFMMHSPTLLCSRSFDCNLGKHRIQLTQHVFPVIKANDGSLNYVPYILNSNILAVDWDEGRMAAALAKLETIEGNPLDVKLTFTNPGPGPMTLVIPPGSEGSNGLLFPDIFHSLNVRVGREVIEPSSALPRGEFGHQEMKEQLDSGRVRVVQNGQSFWEIYRLSDFYRLDQMKEEPRLTLDWCFPVWSTNPGRTVLRSRRPDCTLNGKEPEGDE